MKVNERAVHTAGMEIAIVLGLGLELAMVPTLLVVHPQKNRKVSSSWSKLHSVGGMPPSSPRISRKSQDHYQNVAQRTLPNTTTSTSSCRLGLTYRLAPENHKLFQNPPEDQLQWGRQGELHLAYRHPQMILCHKPGTGLQLTLLSARRPTTPTLS